MGATPRPRRFAWFPVSGGVDLLTDRQPIRRTRTGTDAAGLLGLTTPPTREACRRTDSMWDLVHVLQGRIDDLLQRVDELRERVADLRQERDDLRQERDDLRRRLRGK